MLIDENSFTSFMDVTLLGIRGTGFHYKYNINESYKTLIWTV